MTIAGQMRNGSYCVMLRNYPDVLNIAQLCKILGISKKTGYKLLQEGTIFSLKIGRAYRIPKTHVLSYLRIAK